MQTTLINTLKTTFSKILSTLYKYRYFIFVILICGCYTGILHNQTMPFAEGWYTYYAKCINNGEVAYKDFDYLFTPLYIYLIAFLTRIFGYNIIVLRLFGVVVFCIIGCVLYAVLKEIFSNNISFIASIVAVFYMQSEVVQIFYDYIRIMDIFACCTLLFLIKAIKSTFDSKESKKYFITTGIFNAFFILVKQNMGLVFFGFIIVYIIAYSVVLKDKLILVVNRLKNYLIGLFIPILITCLFMLINGSLLYFFNQTGSEAISAKGGIVAIVFGWLKNNKSSFEATRNWASKYIVLISVLLLLSYLLPKYFKKFEFEKKYVNHLLATLFFVSTIVSLLILSKSQDFAKLFENRFEFSGYGLFQIIVPFFIVYVLKVINNATYNINISKQDLLYIALLGGYVAISFGCGMSAGLAEGQAYLGISFVVCILFSSLTIKNSYIIKLFFLYFCFIFTIQCAAKKMIYTYNWWGMDESNYWDSRQECTTIPLLKGIQMSQETLDAYETIYEAITQNTTENDSIYCFPQIPIFYNICDRNDPGVTAKVQWFDVASDSTIDHDIETIKSNPPKAILIYETSEYAYASHENLFRSGEVSATRRMRNFLIKFACDNEYTFYGRITSTPSNSFLLYIKENDFTTPKQFKGSGTAEDPYQISSADDLILLQKHVQNGNNFVNCYFIQTRDIDLGSIPEWTPIGEFGKEFYFYGIYNGNGFTIKNLKCTKAINGGLFGHLGGTVCNLGLVDFEISGNYVGAIASHSIGNTASIVNCYTNGQISGIRAGGIADNFEGTIINCISYSKCKGIESAGAVSYSNGNLINVYSLYDNVKCDILNPIANNLSKDFSFDLMQSDYILQTLNHYSSSINKCYEHYLSSNEVPCTHSAVPYSTWMSYIRMHDWKKTDKSIIILK